jgi:hypothetical protein
MNTLYKLTFLMYIYIQIGCLSHRSNALDDFLAKVEMNMDKSELDGFREAREDSIMIRYNKFEHIILCLFRDSVQYHNLYNYLDENGLAKYYPESLCFAFHRKLNKQKIDPETLKKVVMSELDRLADQKRKKYEKEQQLAKAMAELNFKNCKTGDLISLKFPVRTENGKKIAVYTEYEAQDSVEIVGRITEINIIENNNIYFTLKLTHIGDRNCFLSPVFFQDNKNFGFFLEDYPRVIKINTMHD